MLFAVSDIQTNISAIENFHLMIGRKPTSRVDRREQYKTSLHSNIRPRRMNIRNYCIFWPKLWWQIHVDAKRSLW